MSWSFNKRETAAIVAPPVETIPFNAADKTHVGSFESFCMTRMILMRALQPGLHTMNNGHAQILNINSTYHFTLRCVHFSLRQSMKTRRASPTNGSNESTVCVDVDSMELEGASIRVYDCAGQVC